MNKIYKVIWSKVKGAYIVVSELAKGYTRAKNKRSAKLGNLAASLLSAMLVAGSILTFPINVYAGQGIEEVPEGNGTYIIGGIGNSMTLFRYFDEETGKYFYVQDDSVEEDGNGGYIYKPWNSDITYSTADSTLEKFKTSYFSNILAGQDNLMGHGSASSIVAGMDNMLTGSYNVIVGGWANTIDNDERNTSSESVIVGGTSNIINGENSAIIGGGWNAILNKSSNPGVIIGAEDALSNAEYLGNGGTVIIGGVNGYAGANNAISVAGGYAAQGIAIGKYASNKELLLIPGAVHTDLYDNMDVIPFDKIEEFFRKM